MRIVIVGTYTPNGGLDWYWCQQLATRPADRNAAASDTTPLTIYHPSALLLTPFRCRSSRCSILYDSVTDLGLVNPLQCKGKYNATSNNIKLVHWSLMGGLLHLVLRGGDWAGPHPTQPPPRCNKCNFYRSVCCIFAIWQQCVLFVSLLALFVSIKPTTTTTTTTTTNSPPINGKCTNHRIAV